jgi:hypothetical protein
MITPSFILALQCFLVTYLNSQTVSWVSFPLPIERLLGPVPGGHALPAVPVSAVPDLQLCCHHDQDAVRPLHHRLADGHPAGDLRGTI